MSKIVKELHTMTTRIENQGEFQAHAKCTSTTHTDALNRQLPTSNASTGARSHGRNRQVLVDKALDATVNCLDSLNEGKLVEKANEAITKMTRKDMQHQTEVKVIGAKKLQNRGVIYELNNLKLPYGYAKRKSTSPNTLASHQ